jgi:Ribbon-helix-helix protein, copG family
MVESNVANERLYTQSVSKRLQILLSDSEMNEIRRLARREKISVGEWVRRALRQERARQPVQEPQGKLRAVRRAVEYSFPTADIEKMLREIEQGH